MKRGERYITPQQAADQIGCSKRTITRWKDKGLIRFTRLPGGYRIPLSEWEAFLTKRTA